MEDDTFVLGKRTLGLNKSYYKSSVKSLGEMY